MRLSKTVTMGLAGACLLSAMVVGCGGSIEGKPTQTAIDPTEPTVSTSRPKSPPPTAGPPADAITLPPDGGFVFIETKSGLTRCQIDTSSVACEAQFTNSPMVDGGRANGVEVTAAGEQRWVLGNLGDIPVVTIDYRTYAAVGWTIVADDAGTRFTNDATRHGMFVSVERVAVF